MSSQTHSDGANRGVMGPLSVMQLRMVAFINANASSIYERSFTVQNRGLLHLNTSIAASGPGKGSSLDLLPHHIRRKIYEYLVIYRTIGHGRDGFMLGVSLTDLTDRGPFILYHADRSSPSFNPILDPRIFPAIVSTSKQNSEEAGEVMYSKNTFFARDPQTVMAFLNRIGPNYIKHLGSLHFWILASSNLADLACWIEVFNLLAAQAIGLSKVSINWYYWRRISPGQLKLGSNIDFIRAFAKIKSLDHIHLGGFYARKWPDFLENETGAVVVETGLKFGSMASFRRYQDNHDVDPVLPTLALPGTIEEIEE